VAGILLFCPAVLSASPNSVPGEKLDSGLGDLSSSYTAAEFQQSAVTRSHAVPGEKLDSGLGDLSPSYTAAEFQQPAVTRSHAVPGEKLDSGLGDLSSSYTAAEFQRAETQTNPAGNQVLGKK
jgi:hypothetical protein